MAFSATVGRMVRSPSLSHNWNYVSKSTYTRRIEIKVSLMCRGLAKQKGLQKSFKVPKFNVRLPQWGG